MMKTRRIVGLVLVLAMVFSLGCGAMAQGKEKITLRFMNNGSGLWEPYMDPIIARYNELHDDVEVQVQYYAQEQLFENIEMSLGSGMSDYDIIAVDVPKVAEYSNKGYLKPLDPFFTQEEKDQFQTACLEAGTFEGTMYTASLQTGSTLLYYNKTLLEQAGVTVREHGPDNRLTFEEIVDMSKRALAVLDPDGSKGICGFTFSQVNKIYAMLQLPGSLGAAYIGEDGVSLDGVINGPEWKKAFEFYQNLYKEGVSTEGINASEANNLFKSGKVLFLMNGFSNYKVYKQIEDYELVLTYNPVFEGYEEYAAAPTGSWNLGVSAFSKHPEEAADFVKFLTIGEGHDMWVELFDAFPAVQADVDRVVNEPDADPGKKIALSEAATIASPRPRTIYYSQYETVMNSLWSDIALGADIDSCVENALYLYNSITAE